MRLETERLIITEFDLSMAESVHKNSLDDDNRRFYRKMFQNWQRIYNKFNDNKMVDSLPNGPEDVTIVFEHPIEDTEEWRKNFCKTVPKDYGYRYKDIEKNMKVEGDCVRLHLNIGRF